LGRCGSLLCTDFNAAGAQRRQERVKSADLAWYRHCMIHSMRNPMLTYGQGGYSGLLPRRTTPFNRIQLYDPAVNAMNDFSRQYPVTVDEDRQIGAALSDMARVGVRSLLVVNELNVVGFITSYDIEGERPIQYIQQFHDVRRNEVQVGHVMTRWHDLVTLNWSAVRTARVTDVLQALRDTNLMHLLVVETENDQTTAVRGLFSRARIERQLGQLQVKSA
jgi:CBS domain-containing protein